MGVTLIHGKYPMRGRPLREQCLTVRGAKRRVREIYADQFGWWFQVYRNGKEVWSSDHEIAKLRRSA